jgi:hypothetical protein
MRGTRLATTGKKVAKVETIRMTNSAEMRAPSMPLYSFFEVASAQMTSTGLAVLRSTLLALKAGVLELAEAAIVDFGKRCAGTGVPSFIQASRLGVLPISPSPCNCQCTDTGEGSRKMNPRKRGRIFYGRKAEDPGCIIVRTLPLLTRNGLANWE